MNQRRLAENRSAAPATARAVASGRAIARFFGTSSPNTIEMTFAISSATPSEIGRAAPAGTPSAFEQRR